MKLIRNGNLKEYMAGQQKTSRQEPRKFEQLRESTTLHRTVVIHLAPNEESRNHRRKRIRGAKHLYHVNKLTQEPRMSVKK